jgi:leucyl-tRNA synthetase
MEYDFRQIEAKWQAAWAKNATYKVQEDPGKKKFYVLDMFPYPSGAGLHVGHPLGYIASDIYARFMRHKGYNVLHPMGYDSFGLPAEQYAILTGQHPAITTEKNIERYREQLDKIGFSYDWSREVRTSSPEYYKWTQWIFSLLFDSWFDKDLNQVCPISELISKFENNGSYGVNAAQDEEWWKEYLVTADHFFSEHFEGEFTATDWKSMTEAQQQSLLMNYRMAYLADSVVNWCPALGTVLANDEIKDGVSERGGHPVIQKKMRQWSMRISAYAERLITELETIEWPENIKEIQRNWIGKSEGARVRFQTENGETIEVFTTRPDTLFGVSFLTLAPEHELVLSLCSDSQREEVEAYVEISKLKTERERMAEKKISGVFTGGYAIHPLTGEKIPVWIGDYVLAGYGTGAVMAVPAGDQRDYDFAKHFNLNIVNIFENTDLSEKAEVSKDAVLTNSSFLNGKNYYEAFQLVCEELGKLGVGEKRINYRLRDAVFSRQRYWGEPFPVYYENGVAKLVPFNEMPVELPEVDAYLPTESGEPPLARANWKREGHAMECNTMPGWAGSSWYFLRYMDPHNPDEMASKEAMNYWGQVDLYMGGAEHATGHLLYSRFWTKALYDLGYIPFNEPFKKMINQGMILGRSSFVYRIKDSNTFVTFEKRKEYDTQRLYADISLVENDKLDLEAFKNWLPEYKEATFILNDKGEYTCGHEVEKMSKSKYNVQTPDELVEKFGADTLRCYEMFLGPVEQSKPWDTQGISGVHNFLRRFHRLFLKGDQFEVSDEAPSKAELKVLHKTIKKITEDLERFSWNTVVSGFMIATNELTDLKCNKRGVLEPLVVMLAPYAPHLAEELWEMLGNKESVTQANWPIAEEKYLEDDVFEYPVSFNGKTRFFISLPTNLTAQQVQDEVLKTEQTIKYLEGKTPKKIIVVPKRIVNIVL